MAIRTFTLNNELVSFGILSAFRIALRSADKVATGKTINSLRVETLQGEKVTTFNVFSNKSFIFVQNGRGANKRPPPKDAIEAWIRAKRIVPRKGSISSLAFVIARAIGKKGIKPTNIIADASKQILQLAGRHIKGSLVMQINETIKRESGAL